MGHSKPAKHVKPPCGGETSHYGWGGLRGTPLRTNEPGPASGFTTFLVKFGRRIPPNETEPAAVDLIPRFIEAFEMRNCRARRP